jgi:hypothetical protein
VCVETDACSFFPFVLKGNLLFPLACQWEINGRCAFLDSANTRAGQRGPDVGHSEMSAKI